MNMEKQGCRICLVPIAGKSYSKLSSKFFTPFKSLKEMLSECIPDMKGTLNDQDFMCENCLTEFFVCFNFLLKCLQTEGKLKAASQSKYVVLVSSAQDNPSNLLHLDVVNPIPIIKNEVTIDDKFINTDTDNTKGVLKKNKTELETSEDCTKTELFSSKVKPNLQKNGAVDSDGCADDNSIELEILENKIDMRLDETTNINNSLHNLDGNISMVNQIGPLSPEHLESIFTVILQENEKDAVEVNKDAIQCKVCLNIFLDKEKYTAHCKTHLNEDKILPTESKKHKCKVCDKSFCKFKVMYKHLRTTHLDYKFYKCEDCLKHYLDEEHLWLHNCKRKRTCNTCSLNFETDTEYRKHCATHENFLCEICGKLFRKKSLLDIHKSMHSETKNFGCRFCDYKACNKQLIFNHEKIHTRTEKTFLCDQCPKKFYSNNKLTIHKKTHLGIKKYACQLCPKKFSAAHCLNSHVTVYHFGIKAFECHLCPKTFGRKYNLEAHLKVHASGGKIYLNSGNNITNDQQVYCKLCKKQYKNVFCLKQHITNVHLRVRKYKCDFCGHLFRSSVILSKHIKTHTLEQNKQFRCDLCFRKFPTKEAVEIHESSSHGKKPKNYKCLECNEEFGRRFLLDSHMNETHGTLPEDFDLNEYLLVGNILDNEEKLIYANL